MKRIFVVLAIVVLILLFIFFSIQKEEHVIKLGGLVPLKERYGISVRHGIELAVDKVNISGGIQGRKVEVIFKDTQGLPERGIDLVQELIDIEKVKAIIGPVFSRVTLAISPIVEAKKVPLISPTSTSPKITNAGHFIFRNCPSDRLQGKILACLAVNEMGLRKIAVYYILDDYGKGLKDIFSKEVQDLGGEIVESLGFQEKPNFKEDLKRIKKRKPDSILILGYPRELIRILKEIRGLNLNWKILSADCFYTKEIIEKAKEATEGVVFTASYFDPYSKEPVVKKFVEEYEARFGSLPDMYAALSYDAANLLISAIKQAKVKGRVIIRNELSKIENFKGVTGITTFDKNGDVTKQIGRFMVKNGEFVPYERDLEESVEKEEGTY
ncbi:MAG: ABC transporter substrate-binding protein [bacterium]|nr:ABC transporter substrate-binding protein [bacterium]